MAAQGGDTTEDRGKGGGTLAYHAYEVPRNVSIASFVRRPRNLFDYVMWIEP